MHSILFSVRDVVTGSAASKVVLYVLADMADARGVCWPSMRYIASRAELSLNTVRKAVRRLESLGLLVVRPGRRGGSLHFQVVIDRERKGGPGGSAAGGGVVQQAQGGLLNGAPLPPPPAAPKAPIRNSSGSTQRRDGAGVGDAVAAPGKKTSGPAAGERAAGPDEIGDGRPRLVAAIVGAAPARLRGVLTSPQGAGVLRRLEERAVRWARAQGRTVRLSELQEVARGWFASNGQEGSTGVRDVPAGNVGRAPSSSSSTGGVPDRTANCPEKNRASRSREIVPLAV